jgi:hypothetical protein
MVRMRLALVFGLACMTMPLLSSAPARAAIKHPGTPPEPCFPLGSSESKCGFTNPDPPKYMAATYYGQIHISPHLVHVGQDITVTAATALGGKVGWSTPPGPIVSGCKGEEPTCTWKATAPSDYPPSEGRSGWSGGWEVYEAGFCGFFGCAPSGDYYYVEGPHGCALKSSLASAADASDCPPSVSLNGSPVTVKPDSGGKLDLSATVSTGTAGVKGGSLAVTLSPSIVLAGKASLKEDVGNLPKRSSKTFPMPADIAPTVVADGHTLGTMEKWSKEGWKHEPVPKATREGGYLVFSDSPEYIAPTTQILPSGQEGGNEIEGVLYQETGATFAATPQRPAFRLYVNHENRTSVAKSICFVFTSDAPGTTVTQVHEGMDVKRGDPVAAGRAALEAYEGSRRGSAGGAAQPVPTSTGDAECPIGAQLAPDKLAGYKLTKTVDETVVDPKTGKKVKKHVSTSKTVGSKPSGKLAPGETVSPVYAAEVLNGIFDYTAAGGDVQVGVVVIDSSHVGAFLADPLHYKFADEAHPSGDPSRTYPSGGTLVNAGESHVSGTFNYDTVKVTLPEYDENDGKAIGALLAGNPKEEGEQYEQAIDTHATDTGNYGVFYQVEVATKGEEGEIAQVLLNPRAIGKDLKLKVVNGFAGLVDVPSAASGELGSEIAAPALGQPGVGSSGNLTDKKYGIGLGSVAANKSFSFEFMPPGGASLPVAAVLAPAYVKAKAKLTYDGGKTVDSEPKIFALRPSG